MQTFALPPLNDRSGLVASHSLGYAEREGAIKPQIGQACLTARIHQLEALLDAVVVPLAARLPHGRVPELFGIAMVRINVVDDGGRNDQPFGLAPDAERRAVEMRKPRLRPAMIIPTLRCTATPPVCLALLLLPGRRTGWPELLCALHILRRQKATFRPPVVSFLVGIAFALALNRCLAWEAVRAGADRCTTSGLLPAF